MELKFRCCFTSREIKRTIRDRDPMMAASTFTLLLTSDKMWKEHLTKYRRQVWKMIPFSSTCHSTGSLQRGCALIVSFCRAKTGYCLVYR